MVNKLSKQKNQMKLQFPKFNSGECNLICWCFPIELKSAQLKAIIEITKNKKRDESIIIRESLTKTKKGPLYSVGFGIIRNKKSSNYLCSLRIEKAEKQFDSLLKIDKIFNSLYSLNRRKIPCTVCASFEFDLNEYRPLLEIPFEFSKGSSKKSSLGKAWLSGIKLEFEKSKIGLKEINFNVNMEKNSMTNSLYCHNKFDLNSKMPIKIFKYVKDLTSLFYEEAKG